MFNPESIILAENSALGQAGQRVNLELLPGDVHDPTEIPTYLSGYKNWDHRADEMSPVILVDDDENRFRNFSQDDTFEPVNVKGALSGPIPEVDPRSTLDTYKVVDRYLGSFIPTPTENQTGNSYRPRMAAARRCMKAINLDRELDVLGPTGLLTTLANWNGDQATTLASGFEWNGGATADPINDILSLVASSAQPVTEIWMNQIVANAFITNDGVRDHMRQLLGDSAAASVSQSLASSQTTSRAVDFIIPGLPPIRVSGVKFKNASGNLVFLMPDVVIGTTVPVSVPSDGEEIATSYTFRRRGPAGVGTESREFRIEGRGPHGGTMVVVALADIAKFTATNAGGIIAAVIQ